MPSFQVFSGELCPLSYFSVLCLNREDMQILGREMRQDYNQRTLLIFLNTNSHIKLYESDKQERKVINTQESCFFSPLKFCLARIQNDVSLNCLLDTYCISASVVTQGTPLFLSIFMSSDVIINIEEASYCSVQLIITQM